MKIISFNINGIRSGISKGLLNWIAENDFDVIGMQEMKATEKDIDLTAIHKLGYQVEWFAAQKKGYSGVAFFCKPQYKNAIKGNGYPQSDIEGRVLQLQIEDVLFINTYFPSGSSGDERQQYKYQFINEYLDFLKQKQKEFKKIIVLGDYNICHHPIDIHDPISNKNSSGFLPDEREWMNKFFDLGFVDTFRIINPHPHQYSWWSFRSNARANNKGWRIDYINISATMKNQIIDARLMPNIYFSDHCPVLLEIK